MSLEDLSSAHTADYMKRDNEFFRNYGILSDHSNPGDYLNANFSLCFETDWHPVFFALFSKGKKHHSYNHAAVTANHFTLRKYQWYQIVVTWDFDNNELALYMNGIKIGSHDVTANELIRTTVGKHLFAGNPTLCYSTLSFYDMVLSDLQVESIYQNQTTDFDADLDEELRKTYLGKDPEYFQWSYSEEWKEKLNLSLLEKHHLDSFYLQGHSKGVKITSEGLAISTPDYPISEAVVDSQLYVWTYKAFEGDLYLEFEFKTLSEGGLSLLMTQASGMQREDFMKDYPLRTAGNMGMVAWSSVRNYHWEYYREMNDVRNDIACGAMLKNPYQYPLGFGCLEQQLEKNKWHKLQFQQIGNKIIGAIDGKIMIDAEDNGFIGQGPVYNFGRIAIRCMVRTNMIFRNLKVYNKNEYFDILDVRN